MRVRAGSATFHKTKLRPPPVARIRPLRRYVQRVVDRKFNRARYDADQMVVAFAARLKDAVDLDSVRDDHRLDGA